MINLIEDIATLTDVSVTTLKKFLNVSNFVIGHAVHESMCEHKDLTTLDLGVGQLDIKVDENRIYYRFTPSKELEKTLIQTITTNTSPMILKLDNKLQEKIDRAYKELL